MNTAAQYKGNSRTTRFMFGSLDRANNESVGKDCRAAALKSAWNCAAQMIANAPVPGVADDCDTINGHRFAAV